MYQTTVKIVQALIFLSTIAALIYAGQTDEYLNGMSFTAAAVVALFVVVIFTVAPWLVFKAVEQGVLDYRRWRSRSSQPARIDPVFTELPDNPGTRGRIPSDSRPRIGK